ncbi:uncharacterized protein LOC120627154 [Pararge aegeria]|uniref:uncharacterized protein LOC120627154 n=1 Tax=Pararge aegeria TaxID=116150 RepID=UPI0019CF69B6|nr:uncharacterized protein LOC120627154 [Pararge aegeria]
MVFYSCLRDIKVATSLFFRVLRVYFELCKMSIGKITEFKVQSDNWKLYVERLEQYFLVNKIGLDLQVPTLITVMGAESYELLVSLCTPDKPNTKSFKELTSIMANHLQPKPSELAERYKFRHRQQGEAESIADYIAVLKKMSKTCEFGTGLQESLRDQLVCGIKSEIIRQRLFAENKLDFAKAYNLAVSLEAAEKDAAMVVGNAKASGETSAVECQAVYSGRSRRPAGAARGQHGWRAASRGRAAAASSGPRSQQGCQACGGAHEESGCNFKAYVCRVCMRRGHIRRVCPNITPHNTVDVTQCNKQAGQDSDSGSDEFQIL